MRLPSKSTPYEKSVLALFPKILHVLREQETDVSKLFTAAGIDNYSDYMSALDCLYALGKIELDPETDTL